MQLIQPVTIKIKMSLVLELFQAQQTFGGYAKVVDGGKAVNIPFDINGMTRIAIGMNVRDLRSVVDSYHEAVKLLRAQYIRSDVDPKTLSPVEQAAFAQAVDKFNGEVQVLLDAEAEVKQRKIKLADLKPEDNPFDPNMYAALDPILIYDA